MTNLLAECRDPVVLVVLVPVAVALPLHGLVVLLLQGLELSFQVDHLRHRHLVLALQDLEAVDIGVTGPVAGRWREGAAVRFLALPRVIELLDVLREKMEPLALLRQGALRVLQLGLGLRQVHEQRRLLALHLQDRRHASGPDSEVLVSASRGACAEKVELTKQVGHGVQAVAFPARSVVPVHLSQSGARVDVAVAAVAVLIVAVGSRDGAAVGPVGVLGELEALNASDSERQMGPGAVDTVAQADVVGQFLSQIVLLLTLTLEGIQGLLQLTLRDVLQT
ncbi:hypothetical protein EYF80_004752 [Liparis tanakae]|uniref:Uncharacterized protein n=1 Tax=Liparis tanakae TaxID=230148 RepID=A0A4Z2J612_9TELE|nr:hypothetical protein EYF80_004752 [Liparis tanakae]